MSFVAVVLLYFLITVKWRHRFENSVTLTKNQIMFFLSGMVTLYIVKGSPVDLLGHILFSVHMAQMAVSTVISSTISYYGNSKLDLEKSF